MRLILFITIALGVLALLSLYVQKRFINKLDIKQKYKNYLKYFLIFNFIAIILYMYGRYNPIYSNTIYFLLSLPIGLLFLFFSVSVVYDLSRVLIEQINFKPQRRKMLKSTLDIGAFALTTPAIAKSVYNALHIEIENVDIAIDNLHKSYTIVQLSDIHIGGIVDKDAIKKIVDKSNSLNPDLVVITGDLVDTKIEYAKDALEELNNLKSTYGTFIIVGNHEYIHGIDNIVKELEKLNAKVLQNESIYIGDEKNGFNLAGVYDMMGYRVDHHKPDINKALKTTNKKRPTILLTHQPRYIKEITDVDLILAGHTHGGQIFPFNYLVRLQQPYVNGLHQHNEKMQIYVNKGTGFWGPPMRLGTNCEISNIRIS